MSKRPLIIDCDPGIDDAAALALAVFAEELDLQLITIVSGNVSCEDACRNAEKLLSFWKRPVPLAKGADAPLCRTPVYAYDVHGKTGMDGYDFPAPVIKRGKEEAVSAMIEVLKKSSEAVDIVAIGPLTNVALLLQRAPELMPKINRLVFMAGAWSRGNVTPMAEFNSYVDPEALEIVLRSGLKLFQVPLEIGLEAPLTEEDLAGIEADSPTGAMLVALFRHYMTTRERGIHLYDSFALAYLLAPELFIVRPVSVAVECQSELTRGVTVIDWEGKTDRPVNVSLLWKVHLASYRRWLRKRLAASHGG